MRILNVINPFALFVNGRESIFNKPLRPAQNSL